MRKVDLLDGEFMMVRDLKEVPNRLRRPVQQAFGTLSAKTWGQIGVLNLAQLAASQLTPNEPGSASRPPAPEPPADPGPPAAAAAAQPGDVTIDPAGDVDGPAKPWLPPEVEGMSDLDKEAAGLLEEAAERDATAAQALLATGAAGAMDDAGFAESWQLQDAIIVAWVDSWSFTEPIDEAQPDGPRRQIPVTAENLGRIPAYQVDEIAGHFPNGLMELFPDFKTPTRPGVESPTEPSNASA